MSIEFFKKEIPQGKELVYPTIHSEVFQTKNGTYYLKDSGVALIAQTVSNLDGVKDFLSGFDPSLSFAEYVNDPVEISPSAQIIKFAGQTCYMSFQPKRTWNERAGEYITDIIRQGHGSVLEHSNFTFLIYGASRVFTHELVRHRAGMAYSQESQRYVGDKVLRFVERPEFQEDEVLHAKFEERIDRVAKEYEEHTMRLLQLQSGGLDIVVAEVATDKRKKVRQASRAVLTNETEAIIVVTGNARAWRHIINMRANPHAEIEIRRPVFKIFQCLRVVDPLTFADFEVVSLPDGTCAVKTEYPKV